MFSYVEQSDAQTFASRDQFGFLLAASLVIGSLVAALAQSPSTAADMITVGVNRPGAAPTHLPVNITGDQLIRLVPKKYGAGDGDRTRDVQLGKTSFI